MRGLFSRFWNDESGAVVATEYLLLGSVVAAGSVGGMVAMRDAVVDEYKHLGAEVRNVRTYTVPTEASQTVQTAAIQSVPVFAAP